MNVQLQPYPLFVAYMERGEIVTGRIVGWYIPNDDDLGNLQPLAVLDTSDIGVSAPQPLDLYRGGYWLADTRAEARESAKKT